MVSTTGACAGGPSRSSPLRPPLSPTQWLPRRVPTDAGGPYVAHRAAAMAPKGRPRGRAAGAAASGGAAVQTIAALWGRAPRTRRRAARRARNAHGQGSGRRSATGLYPWLSTPGGVARQRTRSTAAAPTNAAPQPRPIRSGARLAHGARRVRAGTIQQRARRPGPAAGAASPPTHARTRVTPPPRRRPAGGFCVGHARPPPRGGGTGHGRLGQRRRGGRARGAGSRVAS